jgi:hypothetical protein
MERGLSILWIDAICGSVQNSMTPPEKNVALILAGLLLCLVPIWKRIQARREAKPRSCAAPEPIRSPTTTSPLAMPNRTAKGSGASRCAAASDHRKPGPDGTLGVVLMRLRIAEINQDTVAHVFGDKPREAADRVGDGAVIGADNLAQILGVEARRERGRADEIAEDHGQLAPLGLGYSKASRRGRRPCCGGTSITARQIGDRL